MVASIPSGEIKLNFWEGGRGSLLVSITASSSLHVMKLGVRRVLIFRDCRCNITYLSTRVASCSKTAPVG